LPGPGCLRILPACSAEEAVQRGGCGPAFPPVRGDDPVTGATSDPTCQVVTGSSNRQ